jgi:hypothetical protein
MCGQQQHVMVAEQDLEVATSLRCLLLPPHHQLDDADSVWPVVDQIAHEPEGAVSAAQGIFGIDQTRAAHQIEELLALPVDVPNDVDRSHCFLQSDGVNSSNSSIFRMRV